MFDIEKVNARVFLTVAETGSFRKAADRLGYTQAGISYIVSTMEEAMGLVLFLRERGGVRLSPEGQELLPLMKQWEAWERQLRQTVDEVRGLEKGSLRIQIFDSISIHWIPGIIKKFQDDFPGVSIELISAENGDAARQLIANGEVDCGFLIASEEADLDILPLHEDPLLACVGIEHPLAQAEVFPLARLADYPYISMKYDDHTGIRSIFRKNGVKADTAFYLDNDFAALAMVAKGLGFGIFPELLLKDVPYELHAMPFDRPLSRTICIATRSLETCSRACRKFMEYTQEWVKQEYHQQER